MAMDKATYDKIEQLEQALTTERARNELQQTALASLQLAYDDKVEQIERDLDSVRADLDSARTERATLRDLLEQERATFRDMSDEYERARQGAEQAAQIDRERYDEAQQKVAFALDKMRRQADELDQAQREATELRVKVANLQTTFDVERTMRLSVERACERVQTAAIDLRQQLQQALDENQSLMRQADDLRRVECTLTQALDDERTRRQDTEQAVEIQRRLYCELSQTSQAEIARLSSLLVDEQAMRLEVEQELTQAQAQTREQAQVLTEQHRQARLAQAQADRLVEQERDAKAAIAQELRRLQAALDEVAQERDDLQTGYNVREDDHEQRLARVYAQVADRDQEIADMRLDYYQACTGLDEQRAQVLTLEQQVLVLKAKLYDAYMMHPGLLA